MTYDYSRWWRGLTIAVVPPALRLLVTERWEGQQNVPRNGALIVAANHVSEADPLEIGHLRRAAESSVGRGNIETGEVDLVGSEINEGTDCDILDGDAMIDVAEGAPRELPGKTIGRRSTRGDMALEPQVADRRERSLYQFTYVANGERGGCGRIDCVPRDSVRGWFARGELC